MKTIRALSVIIIIGCLGVLTSNAFAGHHTSFGVGVGYGSHHGHHWSGHHHWGGHWWYPGMSFVVVDYWPGEVVDYYPAACYPPVIERPTVIVKEPTVVNVTTNAKINDETFADVRNKKSELLKKVMIGDKASRMSAIAELGGFTFDDTVREKLSEILVSDPDAEVRKEVAKAFGKLKNEKVLPVLEKVRVSDTDVEVRQEADRSINQINSN